MKQNESGLKRFGVSMEDELLRRFDLLCSRKGYASRSEAIRDMVRDDLIEEEKQLAKSNVVGTLTLVYDHHQRELEEKLTDYQHQFLDAIVSALHVHLDVHLCLEVLILRGRAGKVRRIANRLIATKGVKHGKLVLTSKDPIPH